MNWLLFRLLFYTTISSTGIHKANMDGSGVTDVVPEMYGSPKGIAIDYDTCRICWVDGCKCC